MRNITLYSVYRTKLSNDVLNLIGMMDGPINHWKRSYNSMPSLLEDSVAPYIRPLKSLKMLFIVIERGHTKLQADEK